MVRIITDTSADFEPQEIKSRNIECVPMSVAFGEKEYKVNEDITKNQFYDMLVNGDIFPKTAQPTPFEFEQKMKAAMDNNEECVLILISSALSGTYQNAVAVKDMLEYSDCYVVDSLSATCGQRLLVEQAIKMRDEGKTAKEIYDALEELKTKVKIYACVDTLEYLYKGGRLSKAAYMVGSVANIKPIIYVSKEGKVEVASKALSMKNGISNICKNFEVSTVDENYPLYILYSQNRDNADVLLKGLKKRGFEVPEENIVNIGPTIGTHIGSGACGLVYIGE